MKYIFIVLGISVVAISSWFGFLQLTKTEVPKPIVLPGSEVVQTPSPEETLQYVNSEYAYAVNLSSELGTKEYTKDQVGIGIQQGDTFEEVAQVLVIHLSTVVDPLDRTFIPTVVTSLQKLCSADAPSGTLSCLEVIENQQFSTQNGEIGTRLSLQVTSSNQQNVKQKMGILDPIFVLPLPYSDDYSSFMVVVAPQAKLLGQGDRLKIQQIAQSVKIPSRVSVSSTKWKEIETLLQSCRITTILLKDQTATLSVDERLKVHAQLPFGVDEVTISGLVSSCESKPVITKQ